MPRIYLARCWQWGMAWVASVRRGQGPPHAPMAPPQGTAKPRSHAGDISGKMCVRKGEKNIWQREEEGAKSVSSSWGSTKVRAGGSPGAWADISSSQRRTHAGADGYSWRAVAHRGPSEAEKYEGEGVAEGNCNVLNITPFPPPPALSHSGQGERRLQQRSEIDLGRQGRKGAALLFVFQLLTIWICFNWQ